MNFLCISCYFKGEAFLQALKEEGHTVFLLTKQDLQQEPWPRESIDEFFFMGSDANTPENFRSLSLGLAWLMRQRKIHRIVALDDFDVEKAAYLREEFRIPGMGQTTARYFRDKLAMRIKAAEAGIKVPAFTSLFHDAQINHFADIVPTPWILKPRAEASATGLRKVHSREELWQMIHELGDDRPKYLLEQFKPGQVFHVDAISVNKQVVFARSSGYLTPPFDVAHGGGIFRSHTLEFGGDDDRILRQMNAAVLKTFGMHFSASHTEFIKSDDDGQCYFLETSSRVGGANIAEMVAFASGINLWKEWARIESAMAQHKDYQLPDIQYTHAGIVVSLSRFEHPDTSSFTDPEVVWRMNKKQHIGLILQSNSREKVLQLLEEYARRIHRDFHASAPAKDSLTH